MRRLVLTAVLLAAMACAAAAEYPAASIYNVPAALTTQAGAQVRLDVAHGHPVLISMFYGGCQATCPLIVETLRAIERELTEAERTNLRVLLVSFDSSGDTPTVLAELASTRHIDTSRWTLVRADAADVRQIAAALGVQYRQLPNGEFSHSNAITLLSARGEIVQQSSLLNRPDPLLLSRLRGQ